MAPPTTESCLGRQGIVPLAVGTRIALDAESALVELVNTHEEKLQLSRPPQTLESDRSEVSELHHACIQSMVLLEDQWCRVCGLSLHCCAAVAAASGWLNAGGRCSGCNNTA